VKAAGEMVHIQFNESNGELQVINNLPEAFNGGVAHVTVYNLDGTVGYRHDTPVTAAPATAANLGAIQFPANLSSVHFLKLDLNDAQGKLVSTNFYWRALPAHQDDLTDMNKLPTVTLEARGEQKDADGKRIVTITLHNPAKTVAVMAHVQLRKQKSGERVLPVYYSDNYVSLVPNESRTISIEAAVNQFNGEDALVVLDGWNVTVAPASANGVSIAPNVDAQPDKWPVTGLPFATEGLR